MASNTYGAIKLSTAEDVGAVLKKKTGSQDGYKPKEWVDTINLMGLLPVRTASGSIAHFTDGADDVPLKSLTAQIVPIQAGTGTPSPSNPRPISGTSVLNVEQIENQLIYTTAEDSGTISGITWSFSNGYLKLNGTTTAAVTLTFNLSDNVNLNPSDNRILFNNNADNSGVVVFFRRGTTTIHYWGMSPANRIGINWTDTGNENIDNVMVSITPNNTLHNFVVFPCLMLKTEEPTTTTIDLGQEILGGTADVVGGTGESTHGIVDLGDSSNNWSYVNGVFYSAPIYPVTYLATYNRIVCSIYKDVYVLTSAEMNNNEIRCYSNRLYIKDSRFTDVASFVEGVTGEKVCYELATPTDYTFTGQPINSLLGANNVWTDSGEVLDVEYRADMNLLIAELEG